MDDDLRQVLRRYPQDVIDVTEIGSLKIEDNLDSYYKGWNHRHPIILSAQTGSGKNYFMCEKLLPHAMEIGADIIYLSNRVALSVQQKEAFLTKFKLPNRYGDKLRDMERFGPITVWSYQNAYRRTREIASLFTQRRGYLIFDEAHYFLSDATFNSDTERTLLALISSFPHFTRIYMTATPHDVLPAIVDYELQHRSLSERVFYQDIHSQYSKVPSYPPAPSNAFLQMYEFDRDYSAYDIVFFSKEDSLVPEMKKATKNNKWLFFVNSRAKADGLKKEVSKSAVFSASDKTEDNACWKSLCKGVFPKDTNVLFSTKVIDNGVNITDEAVNNIAVTTFDKTSLLQMIGRCRLPEGKRVKLFIKVPSEQEIRNRLNSIEQLLQMLSTYYQYSIPNKYFFIQNMWDSLTDDVRLLFFFNEEGVLTSNMFAWRELNRQFDFYSHVLFDLQQADSKMDESILPRYILSWLNRSPSDYTELLWNSLDLDEIMKGKLVELLSENSIITSDKQESFYKNFIGVAEKITHPKRSFQNDKRSDMATINKHLERLELPCELNHVGEGNWGVTKKP